MGSHRSIDNSWGCVSFHLIPFRTESFWVFASSINMHKKGTIRLCRYELAGDSGCSCIFLLAVLIRASADISYVGNSFGSLLDRSQVLPMVNHRLTLLSRVQIRRLHLSCLKAMSRGSTILSMRQRLTSWRTSPT